MRHFFYTVTHRREIVALICAGLLLVLGGIFASQAHAAPARGSSGGRLVTIHDRGSERVILTKAQTIGDALGEAHVSLDTHDRIEPHRETPLEATSYTVNIYRARPVIVVDGLVRQKVMTAEQTPTGIAADAGVMLHDEDRTSLAASTDIVADGAGEIMTIGRAMAFTLTLYGTQTTAYTQAKTVGDMLQEKHIRLEKNDTVSVPDDTIITPGMQVAIWRNGVQTVTQEEVIPFGTKQIQAPDQPVGYKQVQTPGQNGKKMVTYQINMQNGAEVNRTEIQSVALQQAVEQVEVVGTKANLPAGSHEDWMAAAGMSAANYGYINYIFTHESGWNPAAVNKAGGYYGLGQTKLSKLTDGCGGGWASDPVCQIGVFNSYAVGRYGSWQAAYDFKQKNGWW